MLSFAFGGITVDAQFWFWDANCRCSVLVLGG